jgi:hypothetical protein
MLFVEKNLDQTLISAARTEQFTACPNHGSEPDGCYEEIEGAPTGFKRMEALSASGKNW